MGMRQTLEVLNSMVLDGIIKDYAIGGAMGAMYYTEVFTTYDLDIFVVFADEERIDVLAPVYQYLRGRGYNTDMNMAECINIEGVPVQFLPAYDNLVRDALGDARKIDYDGVPTKVLKATYLAAICVKVGRPKDKVRTQLLLASDGFDNAEFQRILLKHGLEVLQ